MSDSLNSKKIKIAIVAGEKSGDELGGPLMESLKAHFQDISFVGVGGEKMQLQGLLSLFPMDKISVMGIIEPLLRLKELLSLRKELKNFFLKEKPDIFIGIDSPDFNLPLSKFLKKELGLKTVQYVSPSVWAWRKGRIKSIEKSVDSVITLFPFEENAYKNSNVRTCYAGHPIAYRLNQDQKELIKRKEAKSIALLPGSRKSEISLLADEMIRAAKELSRKDESYKFYMPLSDKNHLDLINEPLEDLIKVSFDNSQEVLSNCEIGIITSGTATLESLLLRTPCVTLYKTGWLSYRIIKPLLSIDNFSLPNLLAGGELLPELLQDEVSAENIIKAIDQIKLKGLDYYYKEFHSIHENLKAGSSETAAKEISNLID
ncbi:MAG: lipid-A-disaccharide synthase [Gammaproteobacteria bacterium]|nr:MAG: lipid-A-disaccharide synthase [Gammaproteobacteria bacterium]